MVLGLGGASSKNTKQGNVTGSRATFSRNVASQGSNYLMLKNKLIVLIVEDNVTIQTIHKKLLSNLGIENQAVENGKEAVDLHSSGTVFDLILMDMEMPVMDGPQATRILRAMGVRSKIVGVTARSQDYEKQAFVEASLDGYHEKPLTRAKLISLLKEIDDSR